MADIRQVVEAIWYVSRHANSQRGSSLYHTLTGPVLYLEAFGQPIVILDSIQTARDLLEKNGVICSDRPRSVREGLETSLEQRETHDADR
jgi:hypothetical protein